MLDETIKHVYTYCMKKTMHPAETQKMSEKQEQNRIDALMAMPEMSIKVLWGKVVERGRGLNFRVHGVHTKFQGVMETVWELR